MHIESQETDLIFPKYSVWGFSIFRIRLNSIVKMIGGGFRILERDSVNYSQ